MENCFSLIIGMLMKYFETLASVSKYGTTDEISSTYTLV